MEKGNNMEGSVTETPENDSVNLGWEKKEKKIGRAHV